MTLSEELWQAWLDQLARAGSDRPLSLRSQHRYRRHLLALAAGDWQALLVEAPTLRVPGRPYRPGAFQPGRLKARPSDLQKLAAALRQALMGEGDSEVFLKVAAEHPEGLLALTLLWGGLLRGQPFQILAELRWADVLPVATGQVLLRVWRPKRKGRPQGYIYLGLMGLPALLLWAGRDRAAAGPQVFAGSSAEINSGMLAVLSELAALAGVPTPDRNSFQQLVRLELLQVLSNTEVAVLAGQLPYHPLVPEDALRYLTGGEAQRDALSQPGEENLAESSAPALPSLRPSLDPGGSTWAALQVLKPLLEPLLARGPLAAADRDRLAEGLDQLVSETQSEPQRANLILLVRWQMDLRGRGKQGSTCRRYWASGLRLLAACGERSILTLTHEDFDSLLADAALASASRGSLRAALKSLWRYLAEAGIPLAEIDWAKHRIPKEYPPVRGLLPADAPAVFAARNRTPEGWSFHITVHSGLRVFEACAVQRHNLQPAGKWPYLVVASGKGDRARRAPLAHLEEGKELKSWAERAKRQASQNPVPPFIGAERNPLRVSETIGRQLAQIVPPAGKRPSYHAGRALAATQAYDRAGGDPRAAARLLGHVWVRTSVGSYLHTIDLQAARKLWACNLALNGPDLFLPYDVLAALMGLDSGNRVRQLVEMYQAAYPDAPLTILRAGHDPELGLPRRRGVPKHFLPLAAAVRLLEWRLNERAKTIQGEMTDEEPEDDLND